MWLRGSGLATVRRRHVGSTIASPQINPSPSTIRLDPAVGEQPATIVRQLANAPLFAGPGGDTYLCGRCGFVLATSIPPRALVGFAIRCFRCENLSLVPAGGPLAPVAQQSVVLQPGEYMITTVDVKTAALVTQEAVTAWQQHVAWSRALFTPQQASSQTLDRAFCFGLERRVEALLGEVWDKIREADARGLRSPTPPPRRHRLAVLVEAAATARAQLLTPTPTIDGDLLSELDIVVREMEHWSADPSWPLVRQALVSPHEYAHALMTMALATVLVAEGNPAAFHLALGRAADLRLEFSRVSFGACEVKAPQALQGPRSVVAQVEAAKIVRKAWRSAGTGPMGQLKPERSGLLAVGGLDLSSRDLDVLEAAAKQMLDDNPRSHLLGIVVLTLGRAPQMVRGQVSISSYIATRIARNAHYNGRDTLKP